MKLAREDRFFEIEPLLDMVEKPARYINHEWGSEREQMGSFHVCLLYPDTYEIGLSNMAIAILTQVLNRAEGISCERSYVPWKDMAKLMRERHIPLLALESAAPVASFDVVGFTLAHEMACTNILEALDLAGIAFAAKDRSEDDALVVAGGPSAFNSEPLAEVFDAIMLGDGEDLIVELCECIRDLREEGATRADILVALSQIDGVYVPSLYEVVHDETSTRWGYARPRSEGIAPSSIIKRTITDLAAYDPLSMQLVPYLSPVFDRLSVEVLRGCARGCRFCQAGIIYRPVRERPQDQIVAACIKGLQNTGYDEVSLTSLSTTDHSECKEILSRLNASLENTGTRVSIPSQRLDSFGVEMALAVAGEKKGGLTFAPEAGSQRLRDVINKNITEEDLERAARNAFECGWRRMKLYFMMGLPTETDEDIKAIPALAQHVLDIGREMLPKSERGGLSVSISVAVFVPKAHTPFQWVGQLSYEEVKRRQKLLLASTHDRAIRVSYHDAETSLIEAALSKAGRDGFKLIHRAWELGCSMDAWSDEFHFELWQQAALDVGFDLHEIAQETFSLEAHLPWEHTTPGVSRGFLEREYRCALEGITTADCTLTSCVGCGICQATNSDNVVRGVRT